MKNILKNRWALSTVVTTLIILVVAVLLAGVVTYYAINVTSTRVQEESLQLMKTHIWYNGGSTAGEAALLIVNTGGRDVVIQKLTVRGQTSDWTNVFYNITSNPLPDDLNYTASLTSGTTITNGNNNYQLSASTTDLTLPSGQTMIVYISNPDSITINDIGLTVGVTVFTSQAMYYQEANVQAA